MKVFIKNYLKQLAIFCLLVQFVCTCEKTEPIKQIVIETGSIIDTSTTTVTLTGNIIDMGEGITTYGHIAATDNTFTLNVKKSSLFNPSNTGIYTSTITDLLQSTYYYVRAYATNSQGTVYGSQISFTTLLDKTFTDDRDGHIYNQVKIGEQIWMAENLAYLPSVSPPSVISKTSPYYYVYAYEGTSLSTAKATTNYETYGVIYNWPASIESCPSGWHLPSDAEWDVLVNYLGGWEVAGGKLKEVGYAHWNSPNVGATNSNGFTALPGGTRIGLQTFDDIGDYGYWWSATEEDSLLAWGRNMYYDLVRVFRFSYGKSLGFSVRCVKD